MDDHAEAKQDRRDESDPSDLDDQQYHGSDDHDGRTKDECAHHDEVVKRHDVHVDMCHYAAHVQVLPARA